MTARTTVMDRAEISRRNGRLSRGPTSPEGKRRSCMNSIKHGMTARLPVLPREDEATYRRLVADVIEALGPRDAVEVVLAEQVASATWRIARAERCEVARVSAALRAAEAGADLPTHDEVAAMGHWLLTDTLRGRQNAAASLFPFLSEDRHDPFRRGRGDPRHIVLRLEATALGCQWLLEQWTRLGRRLERGHDWRSNELIVALHLRGQRPLGADLLEWEGLLESTPADGEPERVAQTRRALQLQLDEGVPGDPAGRRAALGRLVQEETERLKRRKADHERREAADRAELADRLAVDTTAEGERMRRYQLDFDRKLHRALNTLLKLRRASAVASGPDPGGPESLLAEAVRPAIADPDGPGAGAEPGPLPSADAPADLATCEIGPAAGDASAPDRCPVPQNEPTRPTDSDWIPRNEPSPPAFDDRIPRNEPSPPAAGEPIGQNEPTSAAASESSSRNEPTSAASGDSSSRNEPTAPRRIAAPAVAALVLAVAILLLARLSAAFGGPAGPSSLSPDGRSGPAVESVRPTQGALKDPPTGARTLDASAFVPGSDRTGPRIPEGRGSVPRPVRPEAPGRAEPAAVLLTDERIRAALERLNRRIDLAVALPARDMRTIRESCSPCGFLGSCSTATDRRPDRRSC